MRRLVIASIFVGTIFTSFGAFAWTGPTQAPPGGNVAAPINTGSTAQTKSGTLGVNGLAVFGNSILSGSSRYLNWGTTAGSSGYGLRDNAGTMEFKNNGGNWTSIGSSLAWVPSGNNIYNSNSGNVGIGTVSPAQKLDVQGGGIRVVYNTSYDVWIQGGASSSGGDGRNLALVGEDEDTGDRLILNYGGEYGAGTYVQSNLTANSFLYSSDLRFKQAVQGLKDGLEKALALRPVSFVWRSGTPQAGKDDIGFIAQEVEDVLPGIVTTDADGMKSVDYIKLVAILTKAIQEQQAEIDALRVLITEQEQRMEALETGLAIPAAGSE